ncbi:MAG: redox-sensing transcriptional repressor Rex [Treponema sp.]|jgi:redox-sensing transcriptional repressor|nr:redox-sensing transcriptional repressor Rex [Treponema sp.]
MAQPKNFSASTVRRLPSYLPVIRDLQQEGKEFVSATVIAEELQLDSIQVRKDLAMTGIAGTPKKGFPIEDLTDAIERFLGWNSTCDAVLVGAGNLGTALLGYKGFLLHGLNIMAAFDSNARKIGAVIHGIKILNAETMDIQIKNFGVKIALLTVPAECAQKTADILAGAGIEGLWNFTGLKLKVPKNVAVQQEDLSAGYALLRVKMITPATPVT